MLDSFQFSSAGVLLCFVGGAVVLNSFGCLLTRPLVRRLRAGESPEWNSIVGAVLACFGVFYGLFLGLFSVAAYQSYGTAESRVTGEASALVGIYGDLRDYPEPIQSELHGLLREYLRVTVEEDWPIQQQGKIPMAATARLRKFMQRLHAFQPAQPGQETLHASVVQQCDALRDLRRHRMYSVTVGLPNILWAVVLVGGGLNLLLLWLLDLRLKNQLLLGGIVAIFLGMVVGVIVLMDNPFRGPLAIDPEPFRLVLKIVTTPRAPEPG